MIYTAIDTFYPTDEQLKDSPSRKEGIDEHTEMMLRIYGCDLIQEGGILLRLPQAVMATGQVLFHRFYCKKSFTRFSVKRIAASCVWLASKLEESPRMANQVLIVFHRMECRRENLPIEHLDILSEKYSELMNDLIRTERHLLKEIGFVCHVEHPHKFISNYLATFETPDKLRHKLRQEAWNLANDSLRTTLCLRFKSEVIACGVVYAAARRLQIPLPENPPWWLVFDADQNGIEEVCRVLAHLYTLPKAQYMSLCKDNDTFTSRNKILDSQTQIPKESLVNGAGDDNDGSKAGEDKLDGGSTKDARIKLVLDKLKELKNDDDTKSGQPDVDFKDDSAAKPITERSQDREREKPKVKDQDSRGRDSDRDSRRRDSDRDREREKELERDTEKYKERSHHSKDKGSGHSDKSRRHSSRDCSDYRSSHSSREKERQRHHLYS